MRGGRTRFGATPASGQQPPGAWGCKRGCGRQGGGQRVRARGITMLLSAARKTRLGTRVAEERADGLQTLREDPAGAVVVPAWPGDRQRSLSVRPWVPGDGVERRSTPSPWMEAERTEAALLHYAPTPTPLPKKENPRPGLMYLLHVLVRVVSRP